MPQIATVQLILTVSQGSLVYNAYTESCYSVLSFLPCAVLGIFFLLSMLLAIFAVRYDENASQSMKKNYAKRELAVAASFVLCVQHQALLPDGSVDGVYHCAGPAPDAACRELRRPTFELFTTSLNTSIHNKTTVSAHQVTEKLDVLC